MNIILSFLCPYPQNPAWYFYLIVDSSIEQMGNGGLNNMEASGQLSTDWFLKRWKEEKIVHSEKSQCSLGRGSIQMWALNSAQQSMTQIPLLVRSRVDSVAMEEVERDECQHRQACLCDCLLILYETNRIGAIKVLTWVVVLFKKCHSCCKWNSIKHLLKVISQHATKSRRINIQSVYPSVYRDISSTKFKDTWPRRKQSIEI